MIPLIKDLLDVSLPLVGGGGITSAGLTQGAPITGGAIGSAGGGGGPSGDGLLLEDGSGYLLLEDGSYLLLE